ncbi:thiamine-phosphate kinase [Microbacterium gilvum]|uniref:thiamine-phosphate kinase n=1 Tax=Microbacterium gilvum TaxID=1336204 RepID=UPI0031F09B51
MHADPTVGELSEGDILRRILSRTGRAAAAILGPGDDAAVVAAPSGAVVATTDTLVHGPDFRLAWTSGHDLGWKAAAVNLADVAAMGARPTALLVALAMPEGTRISFVEALADGLREACDALAPGCAVVGGDLTVSDVLTVAVTALGDLEGRAPVTRSGARPGDVVAVAGELGHADAGLAVLFGRFRDADGTPLPVDDAVLRPGDLAALAAQLRPAPPVGLGPFAALAGATAMMDVSDGLALDAGRMADASRASIDFASAALGEDPARALAGGEDHALLATFPDAELPTGFRAVGRVIERGPAAVLVDGAPYEGRAGWDPYRDWDAAAG